MNATTTIPEDAALPGLMALCAMGLAAVMPELGFEGIPIELLLCGYTPGKRAALEVRTAGRRFAVKAYASDPSREVALYQAFAAAGLAGDSGVRVPPLLAWNRELQMEAIGWLDGPTAQDLVERGQGQRAGELAVRWLRCAASLAVKLGPPLGAAQVLERSGKWAAKLGAADPALGNLGVSLARILERTQPKAREPHLLHGALYARHLLDLGDGPGLIDWDGFGQGPLEFDAGVFLATIWIFGVRKPLLAEEAARAVKAFLSGTAGWLDERALAWYWAAALLHLAERGAKPMARRPDEWKQRAQTVLEEAARLATAPAGIFDRTVIAKETQATEVASQAVNQMNA
jgi:hypothetical protein